MAESVVKKGLEWIGEKLSGGAAGAAAKDLKGRRSRIDQEVEKADPKPTPTPTQDAPTKEITFKKGGSVARRGDGIAQRGRTKGTMR